MKLVLFDVDGTLVDSQHIICAAMAQTYDRHGLPRPAREQVLSIIGLSLPSAFTQLSGGAPHPIESLVAGYRDAFFAMRQQPDWMEPLFPGAREAVAALAQSPDVVLGVATGKSARGVEAVLGHHRLLDRFVTVQTADSAPSKPAPDMVLNALRDTATRAEDAIVIGDSIYDMQMAKAAGAGAIGVAWGYQPPDNLLAHGADIIIEDFAALLPALEARWRADA